MMKIIILLFLLFSTQNIFSQQANVNNQQNRRPQNATQQQNRRPQNAAQQQNLRRRQAQQVVTITNEVTNAVIIEKTNVIEVTNGTEKQKPKPKSIFDKKPMVHRIGFNTGWLTQPCPILKVSSKQVLFSEYVYEPATWKMGEATTGLSLGLSYDFTLNNGFMFRFQTGFDITGPSLWYMDLGIGARVPIQEMYHISFEGYMTVNQIWATLTNPIANDLMLKSFDTYTAFLGFKFRTAFEVPITQRGYVSVFFSYAIYPSAISTATSPILVNDKSAMFFDSLLIGIEIGVKI